MRRSSRIKGEKNVAYATKAEKMTLDRYPREDLRVQRTHKLILDALLDLTVAKGFAALTVSDITKYAGINRATFYRHYKDKFDLLDSYARTVYELLEAPPEANVRKSSKVDANQVFQRLVAIFEHIRANARFYRLMLGKNGDATFTDRIRQYIEIRIRRSLPAKLPKDETAVDMYVSYSSSASIGAVLWWLEHDMPYTAEEMAVTLHHLETGNLGSLNGKISSTRPGKEIRNPP
jgi:AcrR family transcriptional regulator